jgi:GNAT superfamily N-acetyltransferase
MEAVDLKLRPDLVPEYVALRNAAADWLLTAAVTVEETREWLKRDDVEVHGLAAVGVLQGAVVLYLHRGGEVAVFARQQGAGVGGQLLGVVEPVARRRGCTALWAWVRADNPLAQRVFEKNGYVRVRDEVRLFQGRQYDGVRFEKE